MKVLFIYKGVEWLAIEYLSSFLKQKGHQTDLYFDSGLEGTFYFKSRKRSQKLPILLEYKINRFKPHLIAFSSVTNLFPWIQKMAAVIKRYINIPIIVGGVHPTILPQGVISDPNIDMICRGEGERSLLELVDSMEKGVCKFDISNIWFKKKGEIIKNEIGNLIEDLDSLPFPDKDIFAQYGCITKRAYVVTGRGCPYRCSYCFNHQYQKFYQGKGSYVRKNSVRYVLEYLKKLKKDYNIKSIHFSDDTFTLSNKWIFDFCENYKKEINLPFYCLVRPNTVSEDIMYALKEVGLKYVSMGIESGNDFIRNKILKRNMEKESILKAAEIFHKLKIKLITFNIFGAPAETPEQMWETINLNLKIRPKGLFSYIFYPFPGTELMQYARENNMIDEETVRRIEQGEGSYQDPTLLKYPFASEANNLKTILPIFNKLPPIIQRSIKGKVESWSKKEHSNKLLHLLKIISIPFFSSWESPQRLREQLKMLCFSWFLKLKAIISNYSKASCYEKDI